MTSKEFILSICEKYSEKDHFFLSLVNEVHTIENNGDVIDHVQKLLYLFKDSKQATRWLPYYLKHTQSTQPLHDLCLHITLTGQPMPHLHQFGEGNLKHLFSDLSDLEKITQYHAQIIRPDEISTLKSKSIKESIRLLMKELEIVQLTASGIKIDQLSEQEKINLNLLKKINQRFKRPSFDQANELLQLMTKSQNSDAHLPRFTLTSEEIGLAPGYYMTKLSDQDIRAPLIGYYLDCCQHISGQGSKCVIHAVSSEFGATYAIFKAKVNAAQQTSINPFHDTPVIGSWVWADEGHGIGFDSAEFSRVNSTLTLEEANVFYIEYAQRLLKILPDNVEKIVIGTGGATPQVIGHDPINAKHLKAINPSEADKKYYRGYRDSNSQRILAHREFPKYYARHALNQESSLKEISKIAHPDLQLALALNCSDKLREYKLPIPAIPSWLQSIVDKKVDLSTFPEDPSPNLGGFVPEIRGSVLFYLLPYLAEHPEFCALIEKHLTAELCNGGFKRETVFTMALQKNGIPLSFIDAMFKAGADPNTPGAGGKTMLHRILSDRDSPESIPFAWIERYKFDLQTPDDTGVTPFNLGLKTIAQSHRDYPADSLGGYFFKIYSERLALIPSYEELKEFCVDLHTYKKSPDKSLNFVRYFPHELIIPLLDKFLSQGVEPQKSFLGGQSYFTALASQLRYIFPVRWFRYFTLETETDRKLQFQLFFRFTFSENDKLPEELEYYTNYARGLWSFLQKHNGIPRVISWIEKEYIEECSIATSEYLLLPWLLHKYGLKPNFLMDTYYSRFGENLAFQVTKDSFSGLSLMIAEDTGLNQYCYARKMPMPSFALLKECPALDNNHAREIFITACEHIFSRAKSLPEFLQNLEGLSDIYKKASIKKQDILHKLLLEKLRLFSYRPSQFKANIPRIIRLFTSMINNQNFEGLALKGDWSGQNELVSLIEKLQKEAVSPTQRGLTFVYQTPSESPNQSSQVNGARKSEFAPLSQH